jgi:hypothetical protein
MRRRVSISRRVRELVRSESGIAMPTVLMVTIAAFALGSVAAVASISAQRGSVRDYDAKLALAAADAGAERALYRHNKIVASAEDPVETPCLALVNGALQPVALDPPDLGWCPEVSGTVGTATYRYRVRPIVASGELSSLDVVSIGTSDEISRRIEITANAESGNAFGAWTVIGDEFIDMDSNAVIEGSAATNGSFFLLSNTGICGQTQHGPNGGFNGTNNCPGHPPPTSGSVNLAPVDQGNVATVNSNGRFFAPQANPGDVRTGVVQWDASTRTLTMDSDSTLTLGGTNYSFCKIVMKSNSSLIIPAGADVRVYFDSPENCNQPSGTFQMDLDSNTEITVTSGAPAAAAFLFVGSDTLQTFIRLNSNATTCSEFVVYAPRSELIMDSNSTFCGAVAANSITMDSNAHIVPPPGGVDFTLPVPLHFESTRYVECTGPEGTPPDAGC